MPRISSALFTAAAGTLALVISQTASAGPLARHQSSPDRSLVVPVHEADDDHDHKVQKRHRRNDRHGQHVDGPFTHIESGRRVIVDAPFAHVYVGRGGRRVVAPFVDLWIGN